MKTVIYLILIIISTATAIAGDNDSIRHYEQPQSVVIVEGTSGISVEVIDKCGHPLKYEYVREGDNTVRSHSRFNRLKADCCGDWDIISGGLTFGFVSTPGAIEGISPEVGKSLEIGWLNIIGVERRLSRGWGMSVGIGIDWRNYRSTKGLVYEAVEGQVEVTRKEIENYRFSRIKIFSLQFPVIWRKEFSNKAGLTPQIAFGGILNCNPHGSVKTSWKDEMGKNRSVSNNDIGQRRFTIDLYGQLALGDLGIYVRYSPYKLLTGTLSPDYRPLSFGLNLFY